MLKISIQTKKYWNKFWISKPILYIFDSFIKNRYFVKIKTIYLKKLILRKSTILEIGCGDGKLLGLISKNKNSIGLDLSEFILNKAKKRLVNQNVKFVLGDIFNLKLKNDAFDFVYCDGLVEHYTNEIETLIKKMYTVTKKGGILLIILTNNDFIRKILFRFLYSWDRKKIVNTRDYKNMFLNILPNILPNISKNYNIQTVPKSFGILMAVLVKKC